MHTYTAMGLLCGALIAADILQQNYRRAFILMIVAVLIDATDGTFARKFRVKDVVPHIDGRKLDDIVDYLNYTFLPLLMVGSADWLPSPTWLWASVPLVASVFAFVHTGAKEETNGFFLGFPSYWNVFAFYTAVWLSGFGQGTVLGDCAGAQRAERAAAAICLSEPCAAVAGAVRRRCGWLAIIGVMLWYYPQRPVPAALLWISAVYPVLYVVASLYLDRRLRKDS